MTKINRNITQKIADSDLERINQSLREKYGIDTLTTLPMWRVVWSDDQFEKRYGTFDDITPAGIYIRTVTEVRDVPKYRQWIQQKYILERLVVVPDYQQKELVEAKLSYEPMWTFEDANGQYLPPRFDACEFIINTVLAAQHGTHNLKKYEDEESTQEKALESQRKRVDGLIEELFGEQSSLGGTTKTGESVIVPNSYEKVN